VLDERRPQIHKMAERLLVHFDDPAGLTAEERGPTAAMAETLLREHGYCRECAREAVGHLVRERVRGLGGG
jgi:hypothetical protein